MTRAHKGKALARKADAILATPPKGLTELSPEELETLRRILESVQATPSNRRAAR